VNFGARSDSARTGEKAGNKRSEMWLTARAWLETGALAKDDLLLAELTAPMFSYNAQNALMLEKKEDMKKRGIPSPDVADAFALTFAYPVMAAGLDDEDDGAAAWQSGRSLVTGY
jgi:phage terminase large subunit